jgi:hypothetical protein
MHFGCLFWPFDRLPRANGFSGNLRSKPTCSLEETLLDQVERFSKLGLLLYLIWLEQFISHISLGLFSTSP